jgi:hypothetical protein
MIISILFFSIHLSYAQNGDKKEIKKWIKDNNIEFGSPTTPIGFTRFLDCGDLITYKKVLNDTIIIYSRGGAIAENIDKLNKSIKDKDWNILRYPIYSQDNGTIVIQEMRRWIFLTKSDTLYLLDEYDEFKASEHIKIMKRFMNKEISDEEFAAMAKENNDKDYGFTPKFKVIYFAGIFNKTDTYDFSEQLNFREESVSLIDTWKRNDKIYYQIDLKTHTAGKYVISDDFEFINTEFCE